FYRLRDGWDVGMSKPSAFTVPPRPHKSRSGRKESNLQFPVSPAGRCPRDPASVANALEDDVPFGTAMRAHRSRFAWTRKTPARRKELRHQCARVNSDFA